MPFSFLSSEEYDERTRQHYEAGEYDEALRVVREGLHRYPESAELLVGCGLVRLAREEYAWARQVLERALAVDPDFGEGWAALGEVLLKLGRRAEALRCFRRADALGADDDLELGLGIGRALLREGLASGARRRFARLLPRHAHSAELHTALAFALHRLRDVAGAERELRLALQLDAELHEARLFLAQLLDERGRAGEALAELERVPPEEQWDVLTVWRLIDLKQTLGGWASDDPRLAPWYARLGELETEPDPIDHLLAEVEAAFEAGDAASPTGARHAPGEYHRVRTLDGSTFAGTWEQIVQGIRDAVSGPNEALPEFMQRASRQVRRELGCELRCDTAEAFVRGSAAIGLLTIEE